MTTSTTPTTPGARSRASAAPALTRRALLAGSTATAAALALAA